MLSIRLIRLLQHLCHGLLVTSCLMILVLLGAIAHFYTLKLVVGNAMTLLAAYGMLGSGVLLLLIRFLPCPVCGATFVGKSEPELFTDSCKNCGRQSGDEG